MLNKPSKKEKSARADSESQDKDMKDLKHLEIKVVSLPCETSGTNSTVSDSIFAIKTPAVTQDVATYSED